MISVTLGASETIRVASGVVAACSEYSPFRQMRTTAAAKPATANRIQSKLRISVIDLVVEED